MKRRKFIATSAIASTIPLTQIHAKGNLNYMEEIHKELYELRTYEVRFGGNQNTLKNYLKDILQPSLKAIGVNHFLILEGLGMSEPKKIWVLISYPDTTIYLQAQNLSSNKSYQQSAAAYNAILQEERLYNRYTSSLLLAFDGIPQMDGNVNDSSLFELRIYEGYSEDAVRRKIKMFNTEELPLFDEVELHPVFFGEMISGPYRPCLVYMLHFKDMAERDANWAKFGSHPDWHEMRAKEEYANTVSNIRREFLVPG